MEARVTGVGVLASAHVGQNKNQTISKLRAAALDLSRRSWPRLHEQPSLGWTVLAWHSRLGFSLGFGLQYKSVTPDISYTTLPSLWLPTLTHTKHNSPPSTRAKQESCETLEAKLL